MRKYLSGIAKRLRDDVRGNVAMLTGLSIFALLTATGTSVDMARAQILQAKIQTALDAAGLAAGATANTVDVQTQATKYFNANFPSGYLGSAPVTVTAALASGGTKVTLVATTTQPTTFLQAVGITQVSVGANTEITRTNEGLELALVLDVTGSMGDPVTSGGSISKLNALKCALAGNKAFSDTSTYCTTKGLVTTGLLDILYGTSTSISNMFISFVPFSDIVYLPTSQKSIMSGATSGGCVSARSSSTNSALEPALSVTYPSGSTSTVTLKLDQAQDLPTSSNPYKFSKLSSSDCPTSPLIPLQQDKNTLITGIRAMTDNGSTMINIGLAWGWRTLAPQWQSTWVGLPTFTNTNTSTTYTLPLAYDTPQMNKAVVLMTDGQNTTSSNGAYGSSYPSASTLDNKTTELCAAMKSHGITIYTIGFGPSSSVDSALLSNCASKTSYFFLAPTNASLATAFQQIGDSLASLRVSQ